MGEANDWIRRRKYTFGLAIFFVLWYTIQLTVQHIYGEDMAAWWFYFEHTNSGTPIFTPGTLGAPLSHDMADLTHITGNLAFLIFAGGLIEPRIKGRKIWIIVIGLGYFGMYLANATVPIHQFWNLAGASAGVLSLWAFGGLEMRELVFGDRQIDSNPSLEWIERFAAMMLILGPPTILFHETIIRVHSGHAVGILVGYLYYGMSKYVLTTNN